MPDLKSLDILIDKLAISVARGFERIENRLDKMDLRLDKIELNTDSMNRRIEMLEDQMKTIKQKLGFA